MAIKRIDDTIITSIANAIRTKTNTTDAMNVADMPQKILDISSGGGGSVDLNVGTIEVDTDTQVSWSQWSSKFYTIAHNLGKAPDFFMLFLTETPFIPTASSLHSAFYFNSNARYSKALFFTTNDSGTIGGKNGIANEVERIVEVDANNIKLGCDTTCFLRSGYTYKYIVGCFN